MRRLIGVTLASVMGGLVALAAPVTVSAALLWTLTASPLAVATGTPTTFTLTASNLLLGRIECVVVDVPANFTISSVAIVGSTAGDSWQARRANNRVTAWTTSGGDRLELLDSVTFTISATALSAGSLAWPSNAYDRQDCGGSGSLLGVPPVVVVTGPAVTPSPTPSPPSIPSPLPTIPLPTIPLPTIPLPTQVPPPSPLPTPAPPGIPASTPRPEAPPSGSPTEQPRPTATPDASSPAIGQPGDGSSGPPPLGGNGAQAAGAVDARLAVLRVAFEEPQLELGLGSLALLSGAPTWIVPAATMAGPGLIVLLWVAAQAGGASIWIPAARRLRGADAPAIGAPYMKVA